MARNWAAEFSMPDREFRKIVHRDIFDLNLYQLAEGFGVTREFLGFRYKVCMRKNH
jgi:Zn-dependent peptidase ImmA (M78 family)